MTTAARILWGYESNNATSKNRVPVYTDFSKVVNPHMMVTGDSGTGKTHTLRHAITEVIRSSPQRVLFHLMDVHGDIEVENSSTVVFSSTSPFGLNPLKVNADPHFGGVRRCIQDFISTLRLSPTTGRALGPKQQDVLRNLLLDVFREAGYDAEDPSTWGPSLEKPPANLIPNRIYLDIPYEERMLGKKVAEQLGIDIAWDSANKCWHVDQYEEGMTRWQRKAWGRKNPTLSSLVTYATRRREMSYLGTGLREATLMDAVHSKAKALTRRLQAAARARNGDAGGMDDEAAHEDLNKAKEAYLVAVKEYISSVEMGGALESTLKYDSFESLSTVKQIIDSLDTSGIFRDTPPNFDPKKPVWRYHLKALGDEYKKFFINVRLREIFNRAVQMGECSHLREVIVVDEGAKFVEDDDEHIINVIALEARKFGLGIWFASQSPTHYPDTLLSTMGTKVILGLDMNYWKHAQRQLHIDAATMSWIRPREGLIVNQKLSGQSAQPWQRVISPKAANVVLPAANDIIDDGFSGRAVSRGQY